MDLVSSAAGSPFVLAAIAVAAITSLSVFVCVAVDRALERSSLRPEIKDERRGDNPEFENLHNFRAVISSPLHNRQGLKVRERFLFRSARTDLLTDTEINKLLEFGIRAIIDLRDKNEYAKADKRRRLDATFVPYIFSGGRLCKRADDGSVENKRRYFIGMVTKKYLADIYHQAHLILRCCTWPLLLVDHFFKRNLTLKLYSHFVLNKLSVTEWYLGLLEHAKPNVASIMRLLLDDCNTPVLINCTQGKDRTGIVVAMILGCLDVEDEFIAQDYSLSEAGLGPVRRSMFKGSVGKYGFKEEFATAKVSTMRELLSEIRKRYGGVPGYLSAAGFTTEEQLALRDKFLEL